MNMGIVLTKTAREAWEHYCNDRPGEELPTLLEVMKQAKEIDRPDGLSGDHLRAYQHPEFRSIYFLVTINEDDEDLVIGMRIVRPKKKKMSPPQNKKPEYGAVEWNKLPDGLNDHQIIEWCVNQTAIAYGRIANGECNPAQSNARLQEVAIIRRQAGLRMAKPKLDPLRKVVKRDDFERGQDRERGDVINYLKEHYSGTLDGLVQQLLNGLHRTPLR